MSLTVLACTIIGVLLLVALLRFVLGRMEDRGDLILTTKSESLYGSVGNAVLDVQSTLQPEKRHVIEAKRKLKEKKQESESGDDPLL